MFVDIVGWIAAILSLGSYLPQVYKVMKTKSAKGLSIISFSINIVACMMWTIFAVMIFNNQSWAVNAVIGSLSSTILYFVIIESGRSRRVAFSWVAISIAIFAALSVLYWTNYVENYWNPSASLKLVFGSFASALLGLAFIPQVIKSLKEKQVQIGWGMISIYLTSQIFWASMWIGKIVDGATVGDVVGGLLTMSLLATSWTILAIAKYKFSRHKNIK